MTPRFSIIVPHLNRRQMLREAIASVRAQDFPSTEIIVVDGGSTDGSLDDIRAEEDIRLLTGPDNGVFDAFNKGISVARGQIVAVLNSDDLYPRGTFTHVADAFERHPHADAVCGAAALVEGDRTIEVFDKQIDKALTPRTIFIGNCIPNARFFRREALARIGSFDAEYKYVADRDWLARWHEAGLATTSLDYQVYTYRRHAGSLTFDSDRAHELRIRHELLNLARHWTTASASPEMKRAASLLDGRCVAWLAGNALRGGRLSEFARYLLKVQGRWTLAPAFSVIRSAMDWELQRLAERRQT